MKAPSTSLLRALLRPQQPQCQLRFKSLWMPREKYAKVTTLDKLHRKQKIAIRQERKLSPSSRRWLEETQANHHFKLTGQASIDRAARMYPSETPVPPRATPSEPDAQPPSLLDRIRPANLTPSPYILPYKVLRTPSNGLPIYESAKGGGTKHITTIRKIQGDIFDLAASVRDALKLEPHYTDQKGRKKMTVVINQTTRHVVVRGWRGPEIKRWAEMSGF
jgi:hypothetical protein